jgi:hypothetical protein
MRRGDEVCWRRNEVLGFSYLIKGVICWRLGSKQLTGYVLLSKLGFATIDRYFQDIFSEKYQKIL